MAVAKKKANNSSGLLVKTGKINVFQVSILVLLFVLAGVVYKVYSSASGCTSGVFRSGNSGTCVKYIQTLANHKLQNAPSRYGNLAPLVADGAFGSKTTTAMKAIQKEFVLSQDGVVGSNTWRVLCSQETIKNAGGPFGSAQLAAARGAGCPGY